MWRVGLGVLLGEVVMGIAELISGALEHRLPQ